MAVTRLYVCDGEVEVCEKTCCKMRGTGECAHTSKREHALYDEPREWTRFNGTWIEKVREQ